MPIPRWVDGSPVDSAEGVKHTSCQQQTARVGRGIVTHAQVATSHLSCPPIMDAPDTEGISGQPGDTHPPAQQQVGTVRERSVNKYRGYQLLARFQSGVAGGNKSPKGGYQWSVLAGMGWKPMSSFPIGH